MAHENLRQNVKISFNKAKSDIRQLQFDVHELRRIQEKLIKLLEESQVKKSRSKKRSTKSYVASKSGRIFHVVTCPYAQNIKKNSRVLLSTKVKALNEGYKACRCAH